ncbi:hypothetical protein NKR19_g9937 [Coniochaeta hoffmannii]|uniref:Uncharacterized protein n=1 Tax=Coniochaeta hoffmannii TaxID=91930 RepID=A0AA38VFR7_9PEZI|nr:hypothetical protein NKR19_g9937 [Coniochaeta hoffmannii]
MDNNYVLSSSVNNGREVTWEADPEQHHPSDGQGAPHYGGDPYSIERFQADTPPWTPNEVGVPQGQTWPSSDDYVPGIFPTDSPRSRQGNQGSGDDAPLAEQEEKEEKKKQKKAEKSGGKKGAKGPSKKDAKEKKDGDSKEKGHGREGRKH